MEVIDISQDLFYIFIYISNLEIVFSVLNFMSNGRRDLNRNIGAYVGVPWWFLFLLGNLLTLLICVLTTGGAGVWSDE